MFLISKIVLWLFNLIVDTTQSLPLELKSACVVNVVFSDEKQIHVENDLKEDYSIITHTFTFHDTNSFTISVSATISKPEINMTNGYLRIADKQISSYCIVFVLYPKTFMETTTAIYSSGFGTSDNVIFCIYIDSTNRADIFSHFSKLIYHKNVKPFQAVILFFDDQSLDILVLCYFCPNNNQFHSLAKPIDQQKFINVHNLINGNGYGKFVRIRPPTGIPGIAAVDFITSCFNIFTNHKYGRLLLKKL